MQQTLNSIFAQTFTDYEVIVVDDGSTDDTESVVRKLGDRVLLLRQANKGPGAARNRGANRAAGNYIAFLDSDDIWFPWTLSVYAEAIENANNPAFIAGCPKRFREPAELTALNQTLLKSLTFQDYLKSGDQWRWWGVSSFVINREAFIASGGFIDASVNGEDADLALRLGDSKGFVQILEPATFAYREHSDSVMKNIDKTLAGVRSLIECEKLGQYPGGSLRLNERWRILGRHLRPVSFECLKLGKRADAWGLYIASLRWHISLMRWKYLIGFPMKALFGI